MKQVNIKKVIVMKKRIKPFTIRPTAEQRKEIEQLMIMTQDNTMTKALLKTPKMLAHAQQRINEQQEQISELLVENQKLRNVLEAWSSFEKKLSDYLNKSEVQNEEDSSS